MKKYSCMIVGIACMTLFTAFFVSAQLLDGQWFKLKINGKGFVFDTVTYEFFPSSFKIVDYMNLSWDSMNLRYDVTFWMYWGGMWQSYTTPLELSSGTETFLPMGRIEVFDEDSNGWILYFPARIKIKMDGLGILKSASINDLGCLVEDSYYPANPTHAFYGNCKIKGKIVKIPFGP